MDTRTLKGTTHTEKMADFHGRMAATFRAEAEKPENRKHRAKLLRDAEAADRLARKAL